MVAHVVPTGRITHVHRFELSPNCSLTPRSAALFFAGTAAGSLSVAVYCAALGFWPVLPFAGLELAALGAALVVSLRRGAWRDRIEIGSAEVVVSKRRGSRRWSRRFQRAWTQVRMAAGPTASAPERLMIGERGRWCIVGEFLTAEERAGLGRRLKQVLAER